MRLSSADSGVTGSSGSAGRVDLEVAQADLDAAEAHALVGDDLAGQRHRGLVGQLGDALVELARRVGLLEHDLREAGFVAQDHELHALLVAHRVDPAAQAHGLADVRWQLGYQGAGHRGRIV